MKLAVDKIKLNPENPRIIKDDKYQKLVQSLKDFPEMADVREVVVNKDHIILGGNMRFKAMQEAGWTEIPVKIVDWSENKQKEFVIKDNASFGEWDWDIIANQYELEDLEAWGVDLPVQLQSDQEIEEDEAPEVSSEPPVSKLGEIYQLGRHRVMCGDSTVKENVESLMNGVKADMVFTDPPYGVSYQSNRKDGTTKFEILENDALSLGDTETMVADALKNAYEVSRDGTTVFVWHADSKPELRPLFERAFIGAGFKLSATIIWLKKQASMGFQDYRSRHEPCLYGWKGTRKERVTDRTQTTVWESGRDSNYEHPTQKPVFLAANAIANHNPGVLLDLFLGSGSTLIACEQTDRTCYGMELDPKYVDVIRKRYAKFTNNNELPDNWEELTPAVADEKQTEVK